MDLIEIIPIGKEHKKTRKELINDAGIDVRSFKEQMTKLREKYIIISDDGYYLPASEKEYTDFIEKQELQVKCILNTINLAYKRMEELKNV